VAKKFNPKEAIFNLQKQIQQGVEGAYTTPFVPTGILEPALIAVGEAKHRIVNIQCANKLGKTALVANILKNIFWENDEEYFNYPAYREWPFINDNDKPIKRARILCTPQNAADSGPIREEILKWWPKNRYTAHKAGKMYYCNYETDTGWFIDLLTYEQSPSELEGPMISLQWCDEPPKPQLLGAIMSRFSKGGVLITSQTPVDAPFLDVLDDMENKGTTVKHIFGNIFDNSKTSGKYNLKCTKRGLMSDQEIDAWVKSIPADERPARVEGKNIAKQGKIYPMYDDNIHVRNFEFDSKEAKLWNCYCIMDPHDRRYPAIQWWAVLPPNNQGKTKYVCYNEWPTYDTLAGYYFERANTNCDKTPQDLSKIMKLLDGSQFGMSIMGRGIDPRYARNTFNDFRKDVDSILMAYMKHGIEFTMPKLGNISVQRDIIRQLMSYDIDMPINEYNEPSIFIMPHCRNTRRAFSSHYWEFGKDKEAETYKDFIDTARIFFALISGRGWKMPQAIEVKRKEYRQNTYIDSITKQLKSVALS